MCSIRKTGFLDSRWTRTDTEKRKKKGFIFFTTPNRENTLRSKGKIPEKHYFELSYKEALSFLRNHNLKLVEFKGIYLRPSPKKLHRHIKKRKYLYATLTECGKYFPHLCDTFLIVAQCWRILKCRIKRCKKWL